ncbi:hypothetical protein G7Z17_g11706 [Cylindrodendrum hubeiense]|uniref:Ysc84 actin-binding domain-containing protein n=1 Tax=Cylindrodendrum hubeiense TaxID=595255 RepID=A0A9P5GVF3_9HYPO|nr:hypothetical protein G7Z17_g11706 [Cylindrodendrum hubeiense]
MTSTAKPQRIRDGLSSTNPAITSPPPDTPSNSQMSSSEKIVYNPHEGEQQQGGLLPLAPVQGEFPPPPTQQQQQQPASGEQPYFPPPPPGPPPQQHEQHQEHHDSAPPPAYQQGDFTAPPSEKQQVPPPVTQPQQGEFASSGSEKHFPPPPPGPPPAQAHPNPLNVHPVHPAQGTEQTYPIHPAPPADNYSIPQYNPAAPVFAPPPANEPSDSAPPLTPVLESEAESIPAPAPAVSATTSTEEHHHKKHGWSERFSNLGMKAAAPINSLAHMLGSQSFLPETLDKECDKAASILRTFCKKGVYADPSSSGPPTSTDPKATETNDDIIDPTKNKPKNRVIVTIPPKVISKAVGLAIFTTLRAGFNVSGATGSGILIARLPDGSWGPPSGIQVHSVGGGFSIGLDIYDCVCVINSREALAAFTNTRVSLGTDLAVVAGPYGAGGAVEFGKAVENREGRKGKDKDSKEGKTAEASDNQLKPETDPKSKRRSLSASGFKPVFSYVKSRGFYAGIQIDGTVVVERKEANAAFYGGPVLVGQIIKGEVPSQGPSGMWPAGARVLLDTLKGAEAGLLRDSKDGKDHTAPATATAAGGPSTGPPASGTEQLPAYVDDGVQRPGVGDVKYR